MKKIHLGELSLKINSRLLFCWSSIVDDKLFIFKNLDISPSVIPPSTQTIKSELERNNKDNKCLFELLIFANKIFATEFYFFILFV